MYSIIQKVRLLKKNVYPAIWFYVLQKRLAKHGLITEQSTQGCHSFFQIFFQVFKSTHFWVYF